MINYFMSLKLRCVTPDYNGGLSIIKYYILKPSILMFKSLNFKMSPKPLLKNRTAQVLICSCTY